MTLEELKKIKEDTLPSLALRINECPIKLYIEAGDKGIQNGSRLVLQEALELAANLGLNNVLITQMPEVEDLNSTVVDVIFEDKTKYRYANVTKESIKDIIEGHIVGKKPVESLLISTSKEEL